MDNKGKKKRMEMIENQGIKVREINKGKKRNRDKKRKERQKKRRYQGMKILSNWEKGRG